MTLLCFELLAVENWRWLFRKRFADFSLFSLLFSYIVDFTQRLKNETFPLTIAGHTTKIFLFLFLSFSRRVLTDTEYTFRSILFRCKVCSAHLKKVYLHFLSQDLLRAAWRRDIPESFWRFISSEQHWISHNFYYF